MGAHSNMSDLYQAAAPSVWGLTVTVLTAVLGSSLAAGLITTVLTGARASAATRREHYAAAVEAIVAWAEYPYRVRRRTDDDPATLSRLAELGHDIQERLAGNLAWVAAESSAVAGEFDAVIKAARSRIGESITQAWQANPVKSADGMNVSPFGPGDLNELFERLNTVVRWRFGWRRTAPNWIVRRRLMRNASGRGRHDVASRTDGARREGLGILTTGERTALLNGEDPTASGDDLDPEELAQSVPVEKVQERREPGTSESVRPELPAPPRSSTELIESQQGRVADAPLCLTCGTKMRPAGSCYVCEGCGSTSGCS